MKHQEIQEEKDKDWCRQKVAALLKYGSQQHSQFHVACAAMALQHLHERRFIHRAENLLVDGTGCCKLCDMGRAKQVKPEPRFQTRKRLHLMMLWMSGHVGKCQVCVLF